MVELTIKAKNEKGRLAIKLNQEGLLKMGWKERQMMRLYTKIIRQEHIDENTVKVYINDTYAAQPGYIEMVKGQIKKTFKENGAEDKDYTITPNNITEKDNQEDNLKHKGWLNLFSLWLVR